jgi:sterol 14alpha-demethylase
VRRAFNVHTTDGIEYGVPEGSIVASPMVVNNLLPDIYRDPHAFDPDRFAVGREEDRVVSKLAYTGFSAQGSTPAWGKATPTCGSK